MMGHDSRAFPDRDDDGVSQERIAHPFDGQ